MNTVKFVISATTTGFDAYHEINDTILVVTTGDTLVQLKDNAIEAYNLYAEESGKQPITGDNIFWDMQEVTKCPMMAEVQLAYKSKVDPQDRPQITQSSDAERLLRSIWDDGAIEHREEFVVLMLNTSNRVIGWIKIGSGGLGGVMCDPKLIFQAALLANAVSIILAHNHPSGNVKPSQQDIHMTNRIKDAGVVLDIKLLDHLILSATKSYSFASEGTL